MSTIPGSLPNNRVIRVLVADDETLLAQRLVEYFTEKGFIARGARNGTEVTTLLEHWKPDFVFYDLMLPEMNALTFLGKMNKEGRLGENKMRVFVLSGHNNAANVKECMRLGASEYVAKPVAHADLLARMILHLQPKREVGAYQPNSSEDFESAQYYMHLTDLTLREALKGQPTEDCLHNLTGLLGVSFKAVRVSVIRCTMESRRGYVIASSDKKNIDALEIDLVKYPEISYVLNNDKLLAVDNLAADPTLHFVTKQSKSIIFNSMLVAPIRVNGNAWGVLSIRLAESKQRATEFEMRFAQLVAHVVGLVVYAEPRLYVNMGKQGEGEAA